MVGQQVIRTNVLCIFAASFHLRLIIRVREGLFLTSHIWYWAVGSEIKLVKLVKYSLRLLTSTNGGADLWSVVSRFQHHRTVAELLHEAVFALNSFAFDCQYYSIVGETVFDPLAYDISATLSLLKQFLENQP